MHRVLDHLRLGGNLQREQQRIGAHTEIVASCGSGMNLGYTTAFSQGLTKYTVNSIDLSNIPAGCLGKTSPSPSTTLPATTLA